MAKVNVAKLLLVIRTIRRLSFEQGLFYFIRRFVGYQNVSAGAAPVVNKICLGAEPILVRQVVAGREFSFLNQSIEIADPNLGVDWSPSQVSRLWAYHLHYFDYLRQPDLDDPCKARLVGDWIAKNPMGSTPGWEPFTASKRIVNWVLWFSANPESVSQEMKDSLWEQFRWLELNDERHIRANHFFENVKALLFAAHYFRSTFSDSVVTKFERILLREIKEQFNKDGGHYERSPHYHNLVLEGLLDLLSLYSFLKPNGSLVHEIVETIDPALRYSADMTTVMGNVRLFGDGGESGGPLVEELFGYASRLGLRLPASVAALWCYPITGYVGVRAGADSFVLSCGGSPPGYQPGHLHCDLLSYELELDGRKLVTDSGSSGYDEGGSRTYYRSTAAHSTIGFDSGEQSEIWGAFRVGRMARSRLRKVATTQGGFELVGEVIGFWEGASTAQIRRCVRVEVSEEISMIRRLCIVDTVVSCPAKSRVVSRLVFPKSNYEFRSVGQTGVIVSTEASQYHIVWHENATGRLSDAEISTDFNVCVPGYVLSIAHSEAGPASISYCISRV